MQRRGPPPKGIHMFGAGFAARNRSGRNSAASTPSAAQVLDALAAPAPLLEPDD